MGTDLTIILNSVLAKLRSVVEIHIGFENTVDDEVVMNKPDE